MAAELIDGSSPHNQSPAGTTACLTACTHPPSLVGPRMVRPSVGGRAAGGFPARWVRPPCCPYSAACRCWSTACTAAWAADAALGVGCCVCGHASLGAAICCMRSAGRSTRGPAGVETRSTRGTRQGRRAPPPNQAWRCLARDGEAATRGAGCAICGEVTPVSRGLRSQSLQSQNLVPVISETLAPGQVEAPGQAPGVGRQRLLAALPRPTDH